MSKKSKKTPNQVEQEAPVVEEQEAAELDAEAEEKDPKTLVIIQNNEPRSIILPRCVDGEIDEVKGKQLLPGENNMTQGSWNFVKEKKAVQTLLKLEILEFKGEGLAEGAAEDAQEKAEELEKLKRKVSKAKTPKALKALLEKEKTPEAKDYIRRAIDEMLKD